VLASTRSGRIVLLRRFGPSRPAFDAVGETDAAVTLSAFDTVSGTERRLVDLVDVPPDRRHLLVLVDEGLALLGDDGAFERLEGVDLRDDGNRCIAPRAAAFAPGGQRIGWIAQGGRSLVVREVEGGPTWRVHGRAFLWRAFPDRQGRGATLLEMEDETFPRARSGCGCRWCARFGELPPFGGFANAAHLVHVAEDGKRSPGVVPRDGFRLHQPRPDGCALLAAAHRGEALERGPWQWRCDRAAE
jgi:hypothetical protein